MKPTGCSSCLSAWKGFYSLEEIQARWLLIVLGLCLTPTFVVVGGVVSSLELLFVVRAVDFRQENGWWNEAPSSLEWQQVTCQIREKLVKRKWDRDWFAFGLMLLFVVVVSVSFPMVFSPKRKKNEGVFRFRSLVRWKERIVGILGQICGDLVMVVGWIGGWFKVAFKLKMVDGKEDLMGDLGVVCWCFSGEYLMVLMEEDWRGWFAGRISPLVEIWVVRKKNG